jgi:hypothetical protein
MNCWWEFLILFVLGMGQVHPLNRPLLSIAKRTVEIPGVERGWDSDQSYLWLTEKNLLVWKVDPPHHWRVTQFDFRNFHGVEIDISNAIQTPLNAFNKQLVKRRLRSRHGLQLSPDRKWVIGLDIPHATWANTWYAIALDGSRTVEGHLFEAGPRYNFYRSGAWCSDSLHWITVIGSQKHPLVPVYSITKPKDVRVIPLPALPTNHTASPFVQPLLLGVTKPGHALVITSDLGKATDILCTDLRMDGSTPVVDNFTIHPPNGARVDEIVLSAQGNRLAWRLHFLRTSPSENGSKPTATVELWVSNLDGSDMRQVGYVDVEPNNQRWNEDFPVQVLWLPSGERLSFLYKKAVYTVPIE